MPDTKVTENAVSHTPQTLAGAILQKGTTEHDAQAIVNRAMKQARDGWSYNDRLVLELVPFIQAVREVAGDCYYLDNPGEAPRCCFCQVDEGLPHEVECTMHVVLSAIAKAEGRS